MQKIGLMFSGGGGKGAYEVGVWKALEELNLASNVFAVSGTSVGALNAALFAQGDLRKAESAWLEMRPEDVLSFNAENIVKSLLYAGIKLTYPMIRAIEVMAMTGVFSRDGLLRIIRGYLDNIEINKRVIPCYVCAAELPNIQEKYFSLHDYQEEIVEDILLASSAIPFLFPRQTVNGKQYWDGFLVDNTPIKPLLDDGCDIIISVFLNRMEVLPKKDFNNCKIIPIYPQSDIKGALNFTSSKDKMQCGFEDAMKLLSPIVGLVEDNHNRRHCFLKIMAQDLYFQSESELFEENKNSLIKTKYKLNKEMDKW
ncbi:patatin-like phospholipase family protein [Salinivibrio sp. IB282]|uniref:patatin-like phospholipase family protein n=1 Tax=Salinivibrio sp. IB282 TaxID=1766122 RepID=UPI001301241B|nr:patatin-like phospholipase family protein [Salinivibrio sp. IB282]